MYERYHYKYSSLHSVSEAKRVGKSTSLGLYSTRGQCLQPKIVRYALVIDKKKVLVLGSKVVVQERPCRAGEEDLVVNMTDWRK